MQVPSFFRNPETDEVVVAQWPNPPLWVFLAASVVARVTDLTAAKVVAGGALAWWAVAEIVDGDSPFRRVLGGVVLVASVIGWLAG